MYLIIILIAGICLGLQLALARVPRIRWVPLISTTLLILIGVVGLQLLDRLSLLSAGVFFLGVIAASTLYAGQIWFRIETEPNIPYWEWVARDFTHPRYSRTLYCEQQQRLLDERKAATGNTRTVRTHQII
ncbi:hypothetical protein [Mycetocola spongiae]|uniref:hypothetical protein n=1 Tax=Mycetocola spongiae TaxID=2859226 RepID=UPI001CF2720E|nr:hypothetical protein [Mycetocola spongiae]UCR89991.1 hypothetical protein KXZ72_04820 [Mycetocola spongiae]